MDGKQFWSVTDIFQGIGDELQRPHGQTDLQSKFKFTQAVKMNSMRFTTTYFYAVLETLDSYKCSLSLCLRLPLWTSSCMSCLINTECLSQNAWMISRLLKSFWIVLRWPLYCDTLLVSSTFLSIDLFWSLFIVHNFLLVFQNNRGSKRLQPTWNQAGSWKPQSTTKWQSGATRKSETVLWRQTCWQ